MSELKAYIAPTPDGTGLADYYLKSEADKVIAEKDEEITELKVKLKVQTSNAEKARKLNDSYRMSFYEAVKKLYDKNKVIAELKSQKAQAEDDCAYWKTMAQKNAADNAEMAKQRAEALKMECHHKYKRCLDKAKQCTSMMIFNSKYGTDKKWHLFKKWRDRWLELAKKFKEAK